MEMNDLISRDYVLALLENPKRTRKEIINRIYEALPSQKEENLYIDDRYFSELMAKKEKIDKEYDKLKQDLWDKACYNFIHRFEFINDDKKELEKICPTCRFWTLDKDRERTLKCLNCTGHNNWEAWRAKEESDGNSSL